MVLLTSPRRDAFDRSLRERQVRLEVGALDVADEAVAALVRTLRGAAPLFEGSVVEVAQADAEKVAGTHVAVAIDGNARLSGAAQRSAAGRRRRVDRKVRVDRLQVRELLLGVVALRPRTQCVDPQILVGLQRRAHGRDLIEVLVRADDAHAEADAGFAEDFDASEEAFAADLCRMERAPER